MRLPGHIALIGLLLLQPLAAQDYTIEQILSWADAHHQATGHWPNRNSGQVKGTAETWSRIHGVLINGLRGLSGGTTLAQLLTEYRGKRNTANLPTLTIEQILRWADAHQLATGKWPNAKSGRIEGAGENWSIVNDALRRGIRGLLGGSSLAKLRAEHRGKRNPMGLPDHSANFSVGGRAPESDR